MLADNPSQIKVVVGAEAVHAPPPEDAPPPDPDQRAHAPPPEDAPPLQRRKDIVSI